MHKKLYFLKSMRTHNYIMIIFVGPQGVGKTTQASLLQRKLGRSNYNTILTSLTDYTILHIRLIKILGRLCRLCKNCVMVKFYDDLPPHPSPSPEMYRRLFSLVVMAHLIGLVISYIKMKLLMLRNKMLIEHEGFVFKQIPDLYYLARFAKVSDRSIAGILLKFLTKFILRLLVRIKDSATIVYLRACPEVLKPRYSGRPHIEPSHYISFQNEIYDKLTAFYAMIGGSVVEVDANASVHEVHQNVVRALRKVLSNERRE